jgi:type I restriction enzyme R subunit
MSPGRLVEQDVEEAALAWLDDSCFQTAYGPDLAAGWAGAERSDPTYRDVVLEWRLREALVRLNPELPQEALDDAFRKIVRADGPSLIERNRLSIGCSWMASLSSIGGQTGRSRGRRRA